MIGPFASAIAGPVATAITSPGVGGGAPSLTAQVAALFAAKSALGYMIDSINKSNISQNSDGSGAVTTITDPIGRFTDLSGNGNHFTASGTARAYWDGVGAVFDGVNDGYTSPSINLSTVNKFYLLVVAKHTTPGPSSFVTGHSQSYSAGTGTFQVLDGGGALDNFQLNLRTSTTAAAHRTTVTAGIHTILYKIDLTTAANLNVQVATWLDGVSQTPISGTAAAAGTLGNYVEYLGLNGLSANFANQYRRGLLFGSTAFLTPQEELLLHQWAGEGFFP